MVIRTHAHPSITATHPRAASRSQQTALRRSHCIALRMGAIGRNFTAALLLAVSTISPALAELVATVSQQQLSEGDTITLRITTDSRADSAPDFSPLNRDFIILSQQQSHNMAITNGRRSSSTTWQLSLVAKTLGQLTIPSLQLGQDRSRPIAITVQAAPKNQTVPAADTVLIESSLDRDRVYVGGQSLLTVRIIHRGNLVNASLSEPESSQATIVQSHEASYQRVIDGTPVVVIERVYAVFAETAGTIDISGQTLTAELALGGQRSIFGYSNTKTTRRTSDSQRLQALALPSFALGKDTVTANKLSIEQQWSSPLSDLQVGDSITRTLRISAHGATAAHIPPLFLDSIDGIKIYGDQPELVDTKTQQGIVGVRTESTAYVLTQTGTFEVPALMLHWVDAATGKVQSVSVPSTQLQVAAAPSDTAAAPSTGTVAPAGNNTLAQAPVIPANAITWQHNGWFWVAVSLALLWLLTLLLLWRAQRDQTANHSQSIATSPNQSELFKQLLAAAKANNAAQTLVSFNLWGRSLNSKLHSNPLICGYIKDPEITKSIQRAERSLYQAGEPSPWHGANLATHLTMWQQQHASPKPAALPKLY